jgi:hypothetical protein
MNDNSIFAQNNENQLYGQIQENLTTARAKAYSAVNFAMVEAYWLIGKQIVEAQAGSERAEYGTQSLKYLSEQLEYPPTRKAKCLNCDFFDLYD